VIRAERLNVPQLLYKRGRLRRRVSGHAGRIQFQGLPQDCLVGACCHAYVAPEFRSPSIWTPNLHRMHYLQVRARPSAWLNIPNTARIIMMPCACARPRCACLPLLVGPAPAQYSP
jgi:hypothetical protein